MSVTKLKTYLYRERLKIIKQDRKTLRHISEISGFRPDGFARRSGPDA